jgi:glycosyltransferase involved in cell wall biosynthesis
MVRVSVIVSTYNKVDWLEKVLWGYALQDFEDFELIIADDGSTPETRELILGFAERTSFPLRHLWHPDQGYRRSIILNAAILAARGEYLVFSDGDCIPRKDFVRTHRELARPGRFLSGGSVYLSMEVSRLISVADVESGRFTNPSWLRSRGQRLGRHRLRLLPRGLRADLLDRVTTTRPTWNLNNASTWRRWIFAANGMEAEMQYGGADRALGSRLENLGLRGKRARFRAVLLHLDHDRPYKTKESISKNKGIRARIVERGETRARDGLYQLNDRKESGGFLEFGPGRGEGSPPDWNPDSGARESFPGPVRMET